MTDEFLKEEFIFVLDRPAKKNGADRYTAAGKIEGWNLYIEQAVSRLAGKPAKQIRVTFEIIE